MKKVILTCVILFFACPAFAQFGRILDSAQKAKRLSDIKISDAEERQIGQQVSDKLVNEFGVYQDPGVAKYVSLVGGVMAQASSRPSLEWQFIVLDTDGVNAFAAPGGFIHVTRGLLGLVKNEAELAGVIGHEITHAAKKHTVNSIQKNSYIKFGSEEVNQGGGLTQGLISRFAERAYLSVLNNEFDRGDENESDEEGVQLANKVGYAPTGLSSVLTKLADRNKDRKEPNGLFASHPVIKDRLTNITKTIRDKKLTATATADARYAQNIKFEAKPMAELAVVPPDARGLTGGEPNKDANASEGDKQDEKKKEEKKSGGGLGGALGKMGLSGKSQAQSSQTVASAGARGGWPDRDAVGGSNKSKVPVTLSASEYAEFKKGIA
jgi:predicted Zn-dependent protease